MSRGDKRTRVYLQVTGKQSRSPGLGHHSDLLEGQEVMDVDVVLWGGEEQRSAHENTAGRRGMYCVLNTENELNCPN